MTTSKSSTKQVVSWPVQVFRFTTGKGWESVANADNAVMATPRQGGIEIRKFRVRIRLFGSNKQGDGYASRRLDRIYCPSRSSSGTSGALVLKFRDKTECLEFFDKLLALNPTNIEASRLLNTTTTTTTTTKSSSSMSDTTSRKRRMNPDFFQDDVTAKRRKCDIMSYIIRLLHDDSFLKFVDDIEETLLSTQDGASILAAMKGSSSASSRGTLVVNKNDE